MNDYSDDECEPVLNYARAAPRNQVGRAAVVLVCGLIGLVCPIFAIAAIVLGRRVRREMESQPEPQDGRGMADAGHSLGIAGLIIFPLAVSILLPSYLSAVEGARLCLEMYHLRSLGEACLQYAQAHGGDLPPDMNMLVVLGYITPDILQVPSDADDSDVCDFHYVTGLTTDDPADWIIAYSSLTDHDGKHACYLTLDCVAHFDNAPEFDQQITEFKSNYEASRGEPPNILDPD